MHRMNARKAATAVPSTISRLLKSDAFLKTPPPAYYPLLAHPPAPSLVRSLPLRPATDLPPSLRPDSTPYQIIKAKLNKGNEPLTDEEQRTLNAVPRLTSRPPPRTAGVKKSRPTQIVFPEDRIRRQFFRDHPYEAYRPIDLVEREFIAEPYGPAGIEWTQLHQRSIVPTAEDAISFVINLHEAHKLSLIDAYSTAISQFRTLRAEHEVANRAAHLEAVSHGMIYFGEIQKGILVDERVLDEWINAREVERQLASASTAQRGAPVAAPVPSSAGSANFWTGANADVVETSPSRAPLEFTGGMAYVSRFANRSQGFESQAEQEEEE